MTVSAELLAELKGKYGEAFYLLDSQQFENNFNELKKEFSDIYPHFNIAYSYKTNYTPNLCKIVDKLGGYAEVVSEMELELALSIGVAFENIIWNGPIKNADILEKFLTQGGIVNIDSLEELEVIRDIVNRHSDKTIKLGIRCNFDVNDQVISRFGFDIESESFQQVLHFVLETPNVEFNNLQCHFAKRQIDYWPQRVQGMLDLVDKIGVVPKRIDLGGGLFGKISPELAAQFSHEIPTYADYANIAANLFASYFVNKEERPELIIEPGSALVGDCMHFVATVKTIKTVRGHHIASLLGSQKNINMENVNPPITVYPLSDSQSPYTNLTMVGFTCIEGDILYRAYSGKLGVGDMVMFSNCGSYSLVMKPPFILPNFPVLDVSRGETILVKRQETFNDVFQTFVF